MVFFDVFVEEGDCYILLLNHLDPPSHTISELFFCLPHLMKTLKKCVGYFISIFVNGIQQILLYKSLFPTFFSFLFLGGLYPWHIEVPRLGGESKLQLLAYATGTTMPDLKHVWDLHHSSWKHQIFNPLSKAWDQTHILMDISQVHYH